MPSGYPKQKLPTVIDVEPQRGGLRGRLDRLRTQLAFDAQAVSRTIDLIDQEDRQLALHTFPQKMLTALNHREPLTEREKTQRYVQAVDEPTRKKKSKKYSPRQPRAERLQILTAYLADHSGENTNQIASGLGWRNNQVLKFINGIATKKAGGHKEPIRWFLRTSSNGNTKKMNGHARAVKLPRSKRQDQIRKYLGRHPEAYTTDIANALSIVNNSNFKMMLREVAKPARPTTATQKIQWVLQA